jgi:hypothetical protein
MSLVQQAVVLLDDRQRAMRRDRDSPAFDEIWCVFDRDEHPYVEDALALAAQHGINVAFSNPCFELWLLLHVTDLRRHTDRHLVQSMSERFQLTVGKGLHPDGWPALRASWEQAEARSEALDDMHKGNGSPAGSNPSTSVAGLVRSLRRM